MVLLREDSATRYEGGTRGLRATSSDAGTFNARSAKVREYQDYLRGQQRKVAGAVGAEITRHYTLASNGFVADLSGEQAQQLSASKQVLMLTEDTAFDVDTWNTPDFLGLSGENGAWAQAGGQASAGDGVVVGVLDTGIWPESKSFAGAKLKSEPVGPWGLRRSGSTVTMKKADGGTFTGACETGEQWTVNHCNTKLVGARYYPDAFLASVPKPERSPHEFISTRDGDGHGSHTASTAAGNSGVDVTVEDTEFGAVSGMAPAAKVAAYKVCFEDNDPDTGGCYTSATLAAVEDTIADNVDVVNYSISGATSTVVDAVEYAFEGAAEAGIFVAASAGNSGPGASTVAHNSPWVTTVGASTHTVFENTAVLGDGTKLKGASIARTLPTGEQPLVGAVASKNASADPAQAALCYGGTLDPAKVAGTVVVCDRGVIDRVAKSAEVARAGGVGMIL
ncbi:MAG TPA: S8 family serine peptidase, partial [Nocardioidaceae bacterium]|nr:S8 family serine peptidase [Nocardioidaceae bacterium]